MCKALVGRTRRPVETVSEKDLKRAVYELCWQAIKGSIKIDNVVNMLTDLQVELFSFCLTSVVCLLPCSI